MASRYLTTRAVVLSSRPLGEADRWLTLFTRDLGRIDAVVKGVRRTTSRWGGRLEPFNVCDLVLYRGSSRATVTSAQFVDVLRHVHDDREALTAAAVTCETAKLLFAEGEPEQRVFALLHNALREIEAGFAGRAQEAPLVLGALMKLVYEAGYLPVLDACASCGSTRPAARLLGRARRARLRGLPRRRRADRRGGGGGAARRGRAAARRAPRRRPFARRDRGAARRPAARRLPHRRASARPALRAPLACTRA